MKQNKLRLCTDEEAKEVRAEVKRWLEEDRGLLDIFSDCKNTTKASVGEYIANTKGFTLFKSKVNV